MRIWQWLKNQKNWNLVKNLFLVYITAGGLIYFFVLKNVCIIGTGVPWWLNILGLGNLINNQICSYVKPNLIQGLLLWPIELVRFMSAGGI